jgi:hypothetical protein
MIRRGGSLKQHAQLHGYCKRQQQHESEQLLLKHRHKQEDMRQFLQITTVLMQYSCMHSATHCHP